MSEKKPHLSVLYHETIRALQPQSPGCYIDATLGAGGHAAGILQACSPEGQLLGLDIDPQALLLAAEKLSSFDHRVHLVEASYTTLALQMDNLGWKSVQGILLDLGVSSMQLDTPQRGFSFQFNAPLDMRFSPQLKTSAADLVNNLPERQLADLIWLYGEESKSRQIAAAICKARPLHTTGELAEIITHSVAKGSGAKKTSWRIHPATLTFQALRIAVNQELQSLESVLPSAVAALAPRGRLAVISFHSLEDRMVKQFFRRESHDCICPPEQPVCTCSHKASIIEITRRPIVPDDVEIQSNPRARSARLRIIEKK